MNNSCIQACDLRVSADEPTPFVNFGPHVYSTPHSRVAAPDEDNMLRSIKVNHPPDPTLEFRLSIMRGMIMK